MPQPSQRPHLLGDELTIVLRGYNGARIVAPILARHGPFVVTPTWTSFGLMNSSVTLTHVGTRWAVETHIASVKDALALARALVASGINWRFTNPKRMPKRDKVRGLQIRERWKAKVSHA